MPSVPESLLAQRLIVRAQLLASDTAYWQEMFDRAQVVGQLLHVARQQLDTREHTAPVDETTLHLWEWGLALPQEVASGAVTHLIRWYIDRLREQRRPALAETLEHDSVALVTELTQTWHRR